MVQSPHLVKKNVAGKADGQAGAKSRSPTKKSLRPWVEQSSYRHHRAENGASQSIV
jgi:hypothetical protein